MLIGASKTGQGGRKEGAEGSGPEDKRGRRAWNSREEKTRGGDIRLPCIPDLGGCQPNRLPGAARHLCLLIRNRHLRFHDIAVFPAAFFILTQLPGQGIRGIRRVCPRCILTSSALRKGMPAGCTPPCRCRLGRKARALLWVPSTVASRGSAAPTSRNRPYQQQHGHQLWPRSSTSFCLPLRFSHLWPCNETSLLTPSFRMFETWFCSAATRKSSGHTPTRQISHFLHR